MFLALSTFQGFPKNYLVILANHPFECTQGTVDDYSICWQDLL